MGMKFHRFYVAVLNPLGILLAALIAVVLLLGMLNIDTVVQSAVNQAADATGQAVEEVIDVVNIPLVGNIAARDILWVLFGLAAALFLFMLLTEFLLVAKKKSGIVLLSLSLLLGIASNIVEYINYSARTPWYTMAISVVASALILLYYWKRYKVFD